MKERVSTKKVMKEPGYLYYVDKQGDIARAPLTNAMIKGLRKGKVLKVGIKKNPKYLYYIDKQGYVARSPMMRGRKKRKGGKK